MPKRYQALAVTLALMFWSALLCGACAHTAREAAREATPAAVEGAVEEAQDPSTRRRIAEVLSDRRILDASSDLAESVTEGVMGGLTDQESAAELEKFNGELVEAFGSAFAESLRNDIGPALSDTIARSANATLAEALNADFEERLREVMRSAAQGSIEGLAQAVQQSDGALSLIVGRVARDAAREAALGVNDAVRQRMQAPDDDANLLASVGEAAEATEDGLPILLWIVGIVAVLAFAVVLWLLFRLRRQLDVLAGQFHAQTNVPRDAQRRSGGNQPTPAPGSL